MRKKAVISTVALAASLAISVWVLTQKDGSKTAGRIPGAYRALELWAAQRAYPNATMPDVGHYAGFEYSRMELKGALDKSVDVDPWRQIGPHNIGGRTLAITLNPLNPNTVYAGSASGGLWRSYTGGVGAAAWDYVSTGYPVLGVSSIAIVPGDSNVIYIGTGEVYGYQTAFPGVADRTTRGSYGIGILKTTDGGETWTKSLDWSYNQRRGVQAIKLDPYTPDIVWAATTEGTYKSTDAGATWTMVDSTIMAMSIAIDPLFSNTVFVACGDQYSQGFGIYRTTDGGTTWEKLTNGLPSSFGGKIWLAMPENTSGVIYASIGNGFSGTWLCKSTDAGATWTTVTTFDYAKYQGWYSHFVGVSPNDPSEVICAGIDIYKSTDGGINLQQKSYWWKWYFGVTEPGGPEGPPDYSHADHHSITYHPTNPDIIYFGTDGGVFRSTDGGETFEGLNGGYQTTQFYQGFSSSRVDSALAIGGMQDNSTAIHEGGVAWRRVIGGDGSWTAMDPIDENLMYGSWQGLNMLKSLDGGELWVSVTPPAFGATSFIGPYVLSPSSPEILYAGRSIIYKSYDRGITWRSTGSGSVLDGNPALSMAISEYNSDVVYVGTAPLYNRAGIFRTTDGGTTWQNITGILPDRYPSNIVVDPNFDNIVYVTFSGFGSAHLFRSEDGGDTWDDIGGDLPDVPTSAVAVDPLYPSQIYTGNDLGVYVSTDVGGSWEEFMDGMPDAAMVIDLSISTTNRALRAVTHGNGVYERKLLGEVTGTRSESMVADGFRLRQNYPNPFNSITTIPYTLNREAVVSLAIYNLLGQRVRMILDKERMGAGGHEARWDGRDDAGREVSSGTYVYRLEAEGRTFSRKLAFLK